MNVLIVEDETAAYKNMVTALQTIDSTIKIVGNTESVSQTVEWLQNNPQPDLIFMDIKLSDGSAFMLFDRMKIETPVVFTTAYDQYAIDAFRVNSIDYLLKPIKPDELQRALDKFRRWLPADMGGYLSRLMALAPKPVYKDKILIPLRDKLLPVSLNDVACFYIQFHQKAAVEPNGNFLHTVACHDILFVRPREPIYISKNRATEFKAWIVEE